MNALQRVIYDLQNRKRFRLLVRPFVGPVRSCLLKRSKILFGPMKGLYYHPDTPDRSAFLGTYELNVQRAIKDSLKEGNIFYDIGANEGFFSLLGANLVGPYGHIYAFEPLPVNQTRLRQLMLNNQIANYTIVPHAVSDFCGPATFYLGDGNPRRASLFQWKGEQKVGVSTIELDQFVNEHNWPDLIKLDVEGAEVQVLEGARKLLSSERTPGWIIEVHSRKNKQVVKDILSIYKYRLKELPRKDRDNRPFPLHLMAMRE